MVLSPLANPSSIHCTRIASRIIKDSEIPVKEPCRCSPGDRQRDTHSFSACICQRSGERARGRQTPQTDNALSTLQPQSQAMASRPQDCNPAAWTGHDGRASPSRGLNTGNLAEENVIDDEEEGDFGDEETGRLLISGGDRRRYVCSSFSNWLFRELLGLIVFSDPRSGTASRPWPISAASTAFDPLHAAGSVLPSLQK